MQVSEDVRLLLCMHVHTYEQLEALLLLHGAPGSDWTEEAVARQLGIPGESAAEALRALAAQGVVVCMQRADVTRCYRGPREDLKAVIAQLAEVYEQNRLEVVRLMSANAIDRMRTAAMRAFADAFVLGKGDKGG